MAIELTREACAPPAPLPLPCSPAGRFSLLPHPCRSIMMHTRRHAIHLPVLFFIPEVLSFPRPPHLTLPAHRQGTPTSDAYYSRQISKLSLKWHVSHGNDAVPGAIVSPPTGQTDCCLFLNLVHCIIYICTSVYGFDAKLAYASVLTVLNSPSIPQVTSAPDF